MAAREPQQFSVAEGGEEGEGHGLRGARHEVGKQHQRFVFFDGQFQLRRGEGELRFALFGEQGSARDAPLIDRDDFGGQPVDDEVRDAAGQSDGVLSSVRSAAVLTVFFIVAAVRAKAVAVFAVPVAVFPVTAVVRAPLPEVGRGRCGFSVFGGEGRAVFGDDGFRADGLLRHGAGDALREGGEFCRRGQHGECESECSQDVFQHKFSFSGLRARARIYPCSGKFVQNAGNDEPPCRIGMMRVGPRVSFRRFSQAELAGVYAVAALACS